MTVRAYIAIILCKALRLVSRLLNRGGTAMPGRWALKVCPQLLRLVAKDVKTVIVTGTNGKTTSARIIEQAFEDAKLSYFSNRSGANLISGITTEFVMNSSLSGRPLKDYAIIECDEGAARRVFGQIKPKVVVVTNLFRDQLDRFGEVTYTLESIREGLKVTPETLLCLNADCSLCSSLAGDLPNPAVFFGIDKGALTSRAKPELSDASHCIRCKHEYDYEYVNYGHLGGFYCPACGYRRHQPEYAVADVIEQLANSSTVLMSIRGEKRIVSVNLPALYNVYNAVGALAAAVEMGISVDVAAASLSSFKCGFGRMEEFEFGSCSARMMLVKNPAGCNQVLEFLQNIKESFALVISLNDRTGDGKDISWIWDTEFELLCALGGRLEKIAVAGDRAAEMALRLKYAGIDMRFVEVIDDNDRLVDWMRSQQKDVFIMPTYSAMLDIREAIVRQMGGSNFWE